MQSLLSYTAPVQQCPISKYITHLRIAICKVILHIIYSAADLPNHGQHHFLWRFNTVGWVTEGHLAHKKTCHISPKGSLLEQVVEESPHGNPGSPGK